MSTARKPARREETGAANDNSDAGMTSCQRTARVETLKAYKAGARHLLTGEGGTGKTWLEVRLIKDIQALGKRKPKKVAAAATTQQPRQSCATSWKSAAWVMCR